MSAPDTDLAKIIARIPEHTTELPPESASPIEHYKRGANDSWNLLRYFAKAEEITPDSIATERHLASKRPIVGMAPPRVEPRKQDAHGGHVASLRSLVLLALVEAFERFIKELAATCADQVGKLVLDDRLSVFTVHASAVAAHYDENTVGKALAEGATWLDSNTINTRFRRLLADPFEDGTFWFFPNSKKDPDFWRRGTMDILWQLRHSITHNVGVITRSDAAKLRLLRRGHVDAPRVLSLTNGDVGYAKLFLDDLAAWGNARVAARLAELLTLLHQDDPTLFAPAERAAELAKVMRVPVTIAGAAASA